MKNLQRPIYSAIFGTGGGGPAGSWNTTDSSGNPAGNVVVRYGADLSQQHLRERVSVTTTREKVTYTESQNVRAVQFTVLDTDTTASDANAALAVCFNAFDDAEADLWLTETDLESFDTQRFVIPLGESIRVYTSLAAIQRIDFKAIGAETLRVIIGGA